jgi:hypothetical protein
MLAGQVLSAPRARGQATLEAIAAHAAGSSPRLSCELEEAVDPINEGPGERPPLGPGLPPSIHASGVDCWTGLVESGATRVLHSCRSGREIRRLDRVIEHTTRRATGRSRVLGGLQGHAHQDDDSSCAVHAGDIGPSSLVLS